MYSFTFTQGFFCLLFAVTMSQRPPLPRRSLIASPLPLSCTPSCNRLQEIKNTPDVVCSCSSSCLIYGDCCHDAPFKNNEEKKRKLGCLTLSGLGPVSVVNSCPSSGGVLSEACVKGLGVTTPVTSRDTGTTYSNYYCALCNRDSFNLIDWPVEIQCCKNNRKIIAATVKSYVEYDDQRDIMWAVSELNNGSKVFCECKFYARNDDLNFTKSLELRECKSEVISSCSNFWRDEITKQQCSAYMDPIYNEDKIYRNRHCASCNYENEHRLTCSDEPFNPQLMSPARIFAFCRFRGITNCVHYLRSRGRPVSFSELFSIKEVKCAPPQGHQCCVGEKFDRFLKKCRKLPTQIIL